MQELAELSAETRDIALTRFRSASIVAVHAGVPFRTAQLVLAVTPNSEQTFTPHSALARRLHISPVWGQLRSGMRFGHLDRSCATRSGDPPCQLPGRLFPLPCGRHQLRGSVIACTGRFSSPGFSALAVRFESRIAVVHFTSFLWLRPANGACKYMVRARATPKLLKTPSQEPQSAFMIPDPS
jgi:hypothetical protein